MTGLSEGALAEQLLAHFPCLRPGDVLLFCQDLAAVRSIPDVSPIADVEPASDTDLDTLRTLRIAAYVDEAAE